MLPLRTMFPTPFKKREFILPALGVLSLILSCIIISANKFYWNDELYSYYFLSDPSFSGMITAFKDKINNTPIAYFFLGWIWDKAFGSSELSLRLFSTLGICVAFVLTWITLRRTYSFWATSIGSMGIFFTSKTILSQNAEARMYGLFLVLCAVAVYLYDNFYKSKYESYGRLILNLVIHIAIVQTHLFGAFYSAGILLSFILTDRHYRIRRPKIYLSIIISWLSIILYIPTFLNQADAGKPRTWIPIPILGDLLHFELYSSSILMLSILLFVTGFLFAYHTFFNRRLPGGTIVEKQEMVSSSELPLLVFAGISILMPVFAWCFSILIKPIFIDRYLIPTTTGCAVLLSFVFSRTVSKIIKYIDNTKIYKSSQVLKSKIPGMSLITLIVLSSGLLIVPIIYASGVHKQILPGINDAKYGYSNLPIVVEESGKFVEREFYSPSRSRYFFIVDWETAVDKDSGMWGPQQFKHLSALKRNYPERFKNVNSTGEFLNKYNQFLILTYANYSRKCPLNPRGLNSIENWNEMIHCPQWVNKRLVNNNYKVTLLGEVDQFVMLLAEKKL